MEYKFNKNTRIKIPFRTLGRFRMDDGSYLHLPHFEEETGLKRTSKRGKGKYCYYYFKVVDKKKWMLAKIKYGI